jgi:hypothetical protein
MVETIDGKPAICYILNQALRDASSSALRPKAALQKHSHIPSFCPILAGGGRIQERRSP